MARADWRQIVDGLNGIEYGFIKNCPGRTTLEKAAAYIEKCYAYRDEQCLDCEQARCIQAGMHCRCKLHGQAVLDAAYEIWHKVKGDLL